MFIKNNRGYSLVELMIALTIGTIIIAAATATYIVQNRSYMTQESVAEVNSQAKISHDIVANEIKGAGFGWPTDLDVDDSGALNGEDFMTPVNSTTAPDAVTIMGGLRFAGMLFQQGAGLNTVPCPSLPEVVKIRASTQIAVVSPSGEPVNIPLGEVISIDAIEPRQVNNCAADASGICTNPSNIGLNSEIPYGFPMWDTDGDNMCDRGRPVYIFEEHTYCVNAARTLLRIRRNANAAACTGAVTSDIDELAENIDDLQFAYALDLNEDGIIDEQNATPGFDAGDFINVVPATSRNFIRAVRINILATTNRPDPNYEGKGNPPALIEDNALAATNDSLRRRWMRTMVNIRNR